MTDSSFPRKTREFHNHHFDSTIWNDFEFRDDDIIIATYAKSGTTWMQQIVAQLLFNGDEDIEVAEMSPWVDLRRASQGRKATDSRGADSPQIPENSPADRCPGLFRKGKVHLYWQGWS